jgi:phosphoglycolate phosphatase
MTDAVIFDLDGTLADTPAAIGRLMVRVCAEAGRTVTRQQAVATVGRPLQAAFADLMASGPTALETTRAVTRYRELFDQEVLSAGTRLAHPGAAEGLARLRAAGVPTAVATSKIRRSAHALLEATGLAAYLPVVIADDMVGRGKPDPEMAFAAARELGVPANRCAYVGDTVSDMTMARAAGMRPLAVTYGVDGPAALASVAGEDALCASFDRVVDAVLPSSGAPGPRPSAAGRAR